MAFTAWFTGLPASGKTTLATMLVQELKKRSLRGSVLDGDEIRKLTQNLLGFSDDARHTHGIYVAFTAAMLNRNGLSAAVALVSPIRRTREEARRLIGANFVEIFLDCPREVCIQRDPKGLYKKAASGNLTGMTGHDGAYEQPNQADLTIDTSTEDSSLSLGRIVRMLEEKGLL